MIVVTQAGGLQGYSVPTPDHIVFSDSTVPALALAVSEEIRRMDPDHFHTTRIRGTYKDGNVEDGWIVPERIYQHLQSRFPQFGANQEAVLLLGTPKGNNWRPATMYYPGSGRMPDYVGDWMSGTPAKGEDYTEAVWPPQMVGRKWVVRTNAPRSAEEQRMHDIKAALCSAQMYLTSYGAHTEKGRAVLSEVSAALKLMERVK